MQLLAFVFIIHCVITVHVSVALCTHHQEYIKTVDAITGTDHVSIFHGPELTPHRYMICTCDCMYSFNVLLTMGAESTRNMYSNYAVNNKDDC